MEQDTTRKKRIDKKMAELKFEAGNKKEYEVKAICNSGVYAKQAESHLPGLYHLVAWKS